MLTRFDHAVIAVGDLEEAMNCYRLLGFEVSEGGHHPAWGTRNAIIRFGLDYLELLAIYDEEVASESGPRSQLLLDLLRRHEGLLVGYALATNTIWEETRRLQASGLHVDEPFAMQRRRPDGRVLSWHLLLPGNVAWRLRWPFLIQWDTPDDQRLSWEEPGNHPNGATGWREVAVAVRDLDQACDLYQRQLGLSGGERDEVPSLNARRARFLLGSSRIDLLTPSGQGLVQQTLNDVGEGPFEITLTVKDLDQTRSYLVGKEIAVEEYPGVPGRIVVEGSAAVGARLVLMQQDEEGK